MFNKYEIIQSKVLNMKKAVKQYSLLFCEVLKGKALHVQISFGNVLGHLDCALQRPDDNSFDHNPKDIRNQNKDDNRNSSDAVKNHVLAVLSRLQ